MGSCLFMWVLCAVMMGAVLQADEGWGQPVNRDQSLIVAAERNDLVAVQRLLKDGADVRVRDGQGRTALLAATAAHVGHANDREIPAARPPTSPWRYHLLSATIEHPPSKASASTIPDIGHGWEPPCRF